MIPSIQNNAVMVVACNARVPIIFNTFPALPINGPMCNQLCTYDTHMKNEFSKTKDNLKLYKRRI